MDHRVIELTADSNPDEYDRIMLEGVGSPIVFRNYLVPDKNITSEVYHIGQDLDVAVTADGGETYQNMNFVEFFKNCPDDFSEGQEKPYYMIGWQTPSFLPVITKIPFPKCFQENKLLQLEDIFGDKARIKSNWAFVGGAGCFCNIHFDHDYVHTFLYQQLGKKRVALLSPVDFGSVCNTRYPSNDCSDIESIIRKTEPAGNEFILIDLKPGDLIFIPSMWYHATLCLSRNITFSRDIVDRHNFGLWFNSVYRDRKYEDVISR